MRTAEPAASRAVVESERRLPAPPLRPFVAWYSGYRQEGVAPARHRGLPGPYLTMILTLDDPLLIAEHPDRRPARSYRTLIGGLHTTPAIIEHHGRQSGIQLALTPAGARVLLGMPAGALATVDADATEVLGSWTAELHERIQGAATWGERFAAIDEVLLREADPDRAVAGGVATAWRRLLATGGAVPVSELAGDLGWSTRHLAGRFGAEIGLSPKTAARVVRFDRARRRLQGEAGRPGFTLSRLAAEAGYYDQAHLDRDFRGFAGCPPSAWLVEEFRNVQVPTPGEGADSST